ncbi:MAG: FAD-dependent oxidoreductase [Planctomycetota bacterium]
MSRPNERPDVVVCGAGVIGLTVAVRLQEAGHRVAIVARELPEATTSAVAAAIWYPYLAAPFERVQAWATATFRRLTDLCADPDSGVTMLDAVERLAPGTPAPQWAHDLGNAQPIGAAAIRARVPLCDTRRYLPWLRARFERDGGALHLRALASLDEALALGATVVNCTGLGARTLCADPELVPVRGQVALTRGSRLSEAWLDDTTGDPIYAIPRGDEVVLGGTAQRGDERLEPDADDTERIVAACRRLVPELARAAVHTVRVGLRPWRPAVRLERDAAEPRVVHCYGHGGSGFTLAWGCADEVARLLA